MAGPDDSHRRRGHRLRDGYQMIGTLGNKSRYKQGISRDMHSANSIAIGRILSYTAIVTSRASILGCGQVTGATSSVDDKDSKGQEKKADIANPFAHQLDISDPNPA